MILYLFFWYFSSTYLENVYLRNNLQAVKKRAFEIVKERLGNTQIC